MYYIIPSITWLADDMARDLERDEEYCRFMVRKTLFAIARNELVGELPWDQMEKIEENRETNIKNVFDYCFRDYDVTEEDFEYHGVAIAWMLDVIAGQILDTGDHGTYQKVLFVNLLFDKLREDTKLLEKEAKEKEKELNKKKEQVSCSVE